MTRAMKWMAAALLMNVAAAAHAVPDAEVEAVQMPAWVVRADQRSPLETGSVLRNGDRIDTGPGSRALLRLGDGSVVKLGENARFEITDMQGGGAGKRVFKATLSVLEGAFRFTTAAVYKFAGRREVDVRFRTVTAGIRGTDLWGKSSADREIVCLIEGHIAVTRLGDAPVEMAQPQTVYQAIHSGGAPQVAPVEPAQLAKWAAETEIPAGRGAARKGGKWRVYLQQSRTGDELAELSSHLAEAGYPSRIVRLSAQGKPAYWIYIGGLPDRSEARALADTLRAQFKLGTVSISME
jgi:hypothetical protein